MNYDKAPYMDDLSTEFLEVLAEDDDGLVGTLAKHLIRLRRWVNQHHEHNFTLGFHDGCGGTVELVNYAATCNKCGAQNWTYNGDALTPYAADLLLRTSTVVDVTHELAQENELLRCQVETSEDARLAVAQQLEALRFDVHAARSDDYGWARELDIRDRSVNDLRLLIQDLESFQIYWSVSTPRSITDTKTWSIEVLQKMLRTYDPDRPL